VSLAFCSLLLAGRFNDLTQPYGLWSGYVRYHSISGWTTTIFHSAIIEARMHSERLLDHFRNPHNSGALDPPAVKVDVSNPACGDMLRLWVRFEGDRVAEARFQTRGCTASIAASSALTDWMRGKSRAELGTLTAAVIEEALGGLEPASKHAAVLCVDGVKRLLL